MSSTDFDITRIASVGNHIYDYDNAGNKTNYRYSGAGAPAERSFRKSSSQSNPFFRARMLRGEIVMGSLIRQSWNRYNPGGGTYTSRNLSGGNGTVIYETGAQNGGQGLTQQFMTADNVVWTAPSYPSLILSGAKAKALANIDPTPYQFGEDVGELAASAKHMVSRASDFARGCHKLASEAKHTKKGLQWAAGQWAQARFGILPAVVSLASLAQSMSRNPPSKRKGERRKAVGKVDYNQPKDASTTIGGRKYVLVGNYRYESSAGVWYEMTNPVNDWRDTYGLRTKDIPATVWALQPLSFMVDRVVDISTSIRALTNLADPSIKILNGWYKNKLWSDVEMTFSSYVLSGWTISVTPDTIYEQEETYSRAPWIPTAIDVFPPVIPLKDGLLKDATRIGDLLALGIQRIRSIP